jgi:hypothetical protein
LFLGFAKVGAVARRGERAGKSGDVGPFCGVSPRRREPTLAAGTTGAELRGHDEGISDFRWMVLAEAKRRHFFTAERRAFVGDGQACNWTLHAGQFADFVPILDFLHLASYLYAAAKVGEAATVTERYQRWVRDAWQGRSSDVLVELQRAMTEASIGDGKLPDEHPWRPMQKASTYLNNHQDKMNYPEYRRQGLPTTSSLIESQIKEFNARVKGSEKFWNQDNAEAMLQIIAWTLRDDGPTLREQLANRPGCVFRRRSTQSNAHCSIA